MMWYAQRVMKKVFITAISILLFTVGYSQSLQVVDTKYNYDLKIGDEARTVIKLKNVSDKTLHIQVRRDKAQIGSSQRSFFCWDNDCNEPYINQHYVTQVIEPGEILETFVSVLDAGLNETVSFLRYTFYDRDNPLDFVEVELSYTVKDVVSKELMYHSDLIKLSDIYPNPVSDFAFLDYVIFSEETEVRVVFHNVLGSFIRQYELNPVERELKINTIEFKPGVYFYTLYVDNEGKVTKKLIIKR